MLTDSDLVELVRAILWQAETSSQSEVVDDVECPYCVERIKAKAKKCKHCGEWVASKQEIAKQESPYVSSATGQRLKKMIIKYLRVDDEKITDSARFYEDLLCDEMDALDFEDVCHYEFDIIFSCDDLIFDAMPAVKDLICAIQEHIDDKAKE